MEVNYRKGLLNNFYDYCELGRGGGSQNKTEILTFHSEQLTSPSTQNMVVLIVFFRRSLILL